MSFPASKYTYRIEWSEEDQAYLARCLEFPSLIIHGKTPAKALSAIQKTIEEQTKLKFDVSEPHTPASPQEFTNIFEEIFYQGRGKGWPAHWKLARDWAKEIQTITQCFFATQPPNSNDEEGWERFFWDQERFYQNKIDFQKNKTPLTAYEAVFEAIRNGYHPPVWASKDWLLPGLMKYMDEKGETSLDKCLRIIGKKRTGHPFAQREKRLRDWEIYKAVEDITASTGLSIEKASEILSFKQGITLSPRSIATMYKKIKSKLKPIVAAVRKLNNEESESTSYHDDNSSKKQEITSMINFINSYHHELELALYSNRSDITINKKDCVKLIRKLD